MPDLIVTHTTGAKARNADYYHLTYRELLLRRRLEVGIEPPELPADDQVEGEVQAYISGGRWVTECPHCETAVVIDDQDLVLYCPGCGTNGKWMRVVMPPDREEIERLLLLRPGWQFNSPHRNWVLG